MNSIEKITHAALRWPDGWLIHLPEPNRHCDCMTKALSIGRRPGEAEQGFYTSEKRFVSRTEAYKIAEVANQFLPKEARPDAHLTVGTLYSEDIW